MLTNQNKKCKDFWKSQPADETGMCLNKDASKFDEAEIIEIIQYLPDMNNIKILELGSGIGRFTGYFAKKARKVVAVDFIEKFLNENMKKHSQCSNIIYITRNVMELNFKNATFDFIFINWLLMYLSDNETKELSEKLYGWLKPNGQIFLRESCACASIPNKPAPHTHYRDPGFYTNLFNKMNIESQGNIKIYEEKYENLNQKWWKFKLNS